MRLVQYTLLATLFAMVSACSSVSDPGDFGPGDDPGGPGDNPGGGGEIPAEDGPCAAMDIVFIVDDSGSMGEEQQNLAQNFPAFFNVIDNYVNSDGVPLDYRIAVTTTGRDVDYTIKPEPPFPGFPDIPAIPQSEDGDDGAFRNGCNVGRAWLEPNDSDLQNKFSCLAEVGTGGPSLEMPLHALELALSERVTDGANAGFRRDDALLAFVVLTDEDDCSRTDNDFIIESDQCDVDSPEQVSIDHYYDFLDGYTGARGRWASAVIAGPSSCSSTFGDATKADRLLNFTSGAGANATFSSICQGDLTEALEDALNTFDAACAQFPPVE